MSLIQHKRRGLETDLWMDEREMLTSNFLTSSLHTAIANNTACMLNKWFFLYLLLQLLEGWFQPNFKKKHSHSSYGLSLQNVDVMAGEANK